MVVTLGQQYNVGDKFTVILYTYINRHAEPPNVIEQKALQYIVKRVVIIYDNISIEPHKNRGLGQQQNVGKTSTFILYSYIDRHLRTPNKTMTKDTMSLDYSSLCYIASRIRCMSIKGIRCRRDPGRLSNNYY